MKTTIDYIIERLNGLAPRTAMVLGSGLGGIVDAIENPIRFSYADLEGFPQSGVTGHAGELVAGTLNGKAMILLSGRSHYYEQGDAAVMRPAFRNFKRPWYCTNPLIGEESDARFVGMTSAYDSDICAAIEKAAIAVDVQVGKGTYMWFSGPTFETPAEIKMARTMGADAVGMSTVPERFVNVRKPRLVTLQLFVFGPRFVTQSVQLLADTEIDVATVVNFPHGGDDVKAVMHETKSAVADGATEVDLVLPYSSFKSGNIDTARLMISTVRAVTDNQAKLKVIIESGELKDPSLIMQASMLALEERADFIKTSTGKARGFKPAGGIRTVEDCGAYLQLADDILGPNWVSKDTFRFGASGVLDDVLAALEGGTATLGEDGSASDAHISAFAMAVYFQGLDHDETVALAMAMRDSGDVLTWPSLKGPIVDKHSTGGVGDNVSLMLAPMAAACGIDVPMISGRGLGHTGGTLDKMDSITANLAPADKRFYGVRDVTATVENLSLITASILSKKLAAGLGWLVLDVKFGNGAFMDSLDKARALAKSLVDVANGAGTKTVAVLTDMNEPLASAIGNAVEVKNAVEFLTGVHRDPRLEKVTVELVTQMVAIANNRDDYGIIEKEVVHCLNNGKAAEIFGKMIATLNGPKDFIENYETYLPKAPIIRPINASESGYITHIETRDIGIAVVEMGGGRRSREDEIDHCVGITDFVSIGTKVKLGDRLCTVHARDEAMFENAKRAILKALTIGDKKPLDRPIIAEHVS
ncbi:Thymidine phosphorylase [Nymphon striatum]|nr:Thymidine phosphorylase [Nymphon striatum]